MKRLWSTVSIVLVCGGASVAVAQTLTGPSNYSQTPYPIANAIPEIEPQPPAPPADPKATKPAPAPMPTQHGQHGKTDWTGTACDECGFVSCVCPQWYGRVGASYMTRDDDNVVWFSFDTGNQGNVFLNSRDIGGGWGWGADAVIGYSLGDGNGAIEASYWGIYPGTRAGTALDPDGTTGTANDLDSTFAFDSLDYNGGTIAGFYQNAEMHILRRSYETHNVEVNYVGSPGGSYYGARYGWNWRWLVGLRYMKFNDGFDYITDDADLVLTGDPNEVTYSVDVDNHLIGVQAGGGFDFWFTDCLSFYANAKAGVYGVYMRNRSRIGGSAGAAVVNNALSPYNGLAFNVNSSKDDVAMMAEIDLGMRWAFSQHWSAVGGYRAVGVSGVALSTNQIPQYFADIGGVRDIDSNGSVILHGGYFGLEFLY